MKSTFRVFISATSRDLHMHRQEVMKILVSKDILPVEQSTFPPDYREIEQLLRDKISECDAVICIVGYIFGEEPKFRQPETIRRSYTQMEYDIACQLRVPIYCFISHEGYDYENSISSEKYESDDKYQHQLNHRHSIMQNNRYHRTFSDIDELKQYISNIQFRLHAVDQKGISGEYLLPANTSERKTIKDKRYEPLGKLFKGRDSFISIIRDKLTNEAESSSFQEVEGHSKRLALSGLGGIGKTRTAIEYALRFKEDYNALLFIAADSKDSLMHSIASLTGPMILNMKDLQQGPEEDRIAAAINWLSSNPGWFLIFDNVDTEAAKSAVLDMLTLLSGGHIIITSRLSELEWDNHMESLQLDVLSINDAKDFILERTPHRRKKDSDENDALELVKKLNGLAIALEQAGAYIDYHRMCTIEDYLMRWRIGEKIVLSWSKSLKHYPHSVNVTWETTMKAMSENAVTILRILSFFASDPIPQAITTTSITPTILQEFAQQDGRELTYYDVEEALVEVQSYSMLKTLEVSTEPCIIVHNVVQDVTYHCIPKDDRIKYLNAAIRIFISYAPVDSYRFEYWNEWRNLISHCEKLWEGMKAIPEDEWKIELVDMLALYYMGQEQDKCIDLQRISVAWKSSRYTEFNPSLLLAQNDLALMLPDIDEKGQLYKTALEGRTITHGEVSVEVAETKHNYACYLSNINERERAKTMMKSALEIHSKVNGEFHWRTLMAENSLASIMYRSGEVDAACTLLDNNIIKKENHLGDNHQDTLMAIAQRAGWFENINELMQAEILRRKYIDRAKYAYGKEHRKTLDGMQYLMSNLLSQNKEDEADILLSDIISVQTRLFGINHDGTIMCILHRGNYCYRSKDYEKAYTHYLDALKRISTGKNPKNATLPTIFFNIKEALTAMGAHEKLLNHFLENYKLVQDVLVEENDSSLRIREFALLAFELKQYTHAKELLMILLQRGYEVPGTCSHLARVNVLLDQFDSAEEIVLFGWEKIDDAPTYVVGRLLWWRIFFAFLKGVPEKEFIALIKENCRKDNMDMHWTMQPVMDAIKGKVTEREHTFLSALVDALSDRKNLDKLNEFAEWREIE